MKSVVEKLEDIVDQIESDEAEFSDNADMNQKYRWASTLRRTIKHIKKLEKVSLSV